MADQRMVGHAIRRREGAAASHLGQAGGGAMARNGGHPSGSWSPPGPSTSTGGEAAAVRGGGVQQGRLKGVPDVYETGTGSTGRGTSARSLVSDSTAFVSGVSAGRESEPAPARGKLSPQESAGARLTVSPSMKTPTESPVPTQGAGYTIPSSSSRSGEFGGGAQEAHRG